MEIKHKINNTAQAISLLQQCRPLVTPSQAQQYLYQQFIHYRLLSLYQQYFPEQYLNSQASIYPSLTEETWGYTAKEWEFLQLVNQCLFPLPYLDYYEEGYYPFDLDLIVITPMGFGWLELDSIEVLEPCLQLLFPLTKIGFTYCEESGEFAQQWYQELLPDSLQLTDFASPYSINWQKFNYRCHQNSNFSQFFPLVLKALDLETRNPWLDEKGGCCDDYYHTTYLWSETNLNYLTRKYQQAERILGKIVAFTEWLEQDLNTNFLFLLQLWNSTSSTHQYWQKL